jgi:aminotransferase
VRVMLEKARRMEMDGRRIIHLEIGEPDFPTPLHIVEAAKKALDEGYTHYSSNAGLPELRAAIAEKLDRDNGIYVKPDSGIIVTVGANEATFLIDQAFLDPGDQVIIIEPGFATHKQQVQLAGAIPIPVSSNEDEEYTVSTSDIEKKITSRTKMIILNSPTNPTGAVLSKDTIEGIADLAKRRQILVLSDEIYEKITYDGAKHYSIASFPGIEDLALTVNGFSKAYAMTGWRVGYVAGNPELVKHMLKLHQMTVTCAPVMAQKAAVAALKGSQDSLLAMVNEYCRRREETMKGLQEISGMTAFPPMGTFYVFPNVARFGVSAERLAEILLSAAGVATTPGNAFGSSDHIRLSFANSVENIVEAMDRIKEAVKRLDSV